MLSLRTASFFLHSVSSIIKVKEIPRKLTKKISFQEICPSWKQMLGIDKKAIFPIKNIYLYI